VTIVTGRAGPLPDGGELVAIACSGDDGATQRMLERLGSPNKSIQSALSQAIRGYMRLEDAWYERKTSSAISVEQPKEAVRP